MRFRTILFTILLILGMLSVAHASATLGTIDPRNVGNWKAVILDSSGNNGTTINFGKFTTQSAYNITVSDTELRGYAWGEAVGWIVTNCADTTSGCSSTNANFKVTNTAGVLSGYAWGQATGWINFGPFVNNAAPQVKIASDGLFGGTTGAAGYAWSQNFGWIKFDCSNPASCTETDWGIVDVCPDKEGNQTDPDECDDGGGGGQLPYCKNFPYGHPLYTVVAPPPGYVRDADGNCYIPTTPPICLNHPTFTAIPQGWTRDANGNCYPPIQPPGDTCQMRGDCPVTPPYCKNYPTYTAATLPSGWTRDADGNCYPPIQPPGDTCEKRGDCPITKDPCLVDPASCKHTEGGGKLDGWIPIVGLVAPLLYSIFTFFFTNPITIIEALIRLWGVFIGFFVPRKRPWGVVYDSMSKQPLDPAYVVLYDMTGKEIATSLTDIDGRYGFSVNPGQYHMVVSKTNYAFPSVKLSGKTHDELYEDLYFGEVIEIKEENELIAKNIPMDRLNFDWNQYAKEEQGRTKYYHRRDVFLSRLSILLFILGFAYSLFALAVTYSTYNICIVILYIVFLFIRMGDKRNRMANGSIADRTTGTPLAYAILRARSAAVGTEVTHKVTDRLGRYYAIIGDGTYTIAVDKKNTDASYTQVQVPGEVTVDKGILKKNFKV